MSVDSLRLTLSSCSGTFGGWWRVRWSPGGGVVLKMWLHGRFGRKVKASSHECAVETEQEAIRWTMLLSPACFVISAQFCPFCKGYWKLLSIEVYTPV